MQIAECEIDNLIFGFTDAGQIILPAGIAQVEYQRRFWLFEYAVKLASHMQYHASMMGKSSVEIHLDVFNRGATWRDNFIADEITLFLNGEIYKLFKPWMLGRAIDVRNIVESQWGCDLARNYETYQSWGFVYLLKSVPFNYYKIGLTNDPQSRFKNFGVKLPFEVECLHLIPHKNPRKLEAELHEKYAAKRMGGEWFDLIPADVNEIMAVPSGGIG